MTAQPNGHDPLVLGGITLHSRLIAGTGKFKSVEETREALRESGTEMVTVAIRRVNLEERGKESLLGMLAAEGYRLLPNTAGCYTVDDAVLTARLAREALDTSLIKLEVIGDQRTLFPDVPATLEAARILIADGFTVLPYCTDDPVTAQRLEALGCPAVMPLAAPIGSGLGIRNPYNIHLIRETVKVPVIVDAGVGTASDAAVAMELGCDAVLMNTGIACATDPVRMARAMRLAVQAGREAFRAGRIPRKLYATASSPLEGVVGA